MIMYFMIAKSFRYDGLQQVVDSASTRLLGSGQESGKKSDPAGKHGKIMITLPMVVVRQRDIKGKPYGAKS